MTTFDERERALEDKFFHDQELRWRTKVRRNRLFADWAAERLLLPGAARSALVADALAIRDTQGHDEQIQRLMTDTFAQHGAEIDAADLTAALHDCERQAHEQLMSALEQPAPGVTAEGLRGSV
jgi:hypothetical protein